MYLGSSAIHLQMKCSNFEVPLNDPLKLMISTTLK